jgi:hypothetical protein
MVLNTPALLRYSAVFRYSGKTGILDQNQFASDRITPLLACD